MFELLHSVFPEHEWKEALFEGTPRQPIAKNKKNNPGNYTPIKTTRQVLDSIATELGVKQLSDWYSVSPVTLKRKVRGGLRLLQKFDGSLSAALKLAYPYHEWDPSKFYRPNVRQCLLAFFFFFF
jgi:hypothetical protein